MSFNYYPGKNFDIDLTLELQNWMFKSSDTLHKTSYLLAIIRKLLGTQIISFLQIQKIKKKVQLSGSAVQVDFQSTETPKIRSAVQMDFRSTETPKICSVFQVGWASEERNPKNKDSFNELLKNENPR
ncbi:hypothetical protein RhiirB3_426955 [Rhizophagus irregularis]|nr:hypothetical protein RhiirB3_426955 [Rhizophagus irregularis]